MILTNGCSFTEGFSLANKNDAWPAQLGSLLNSTVMDLSLGGASNQRILRTTQESLVNHKNIDLVVIGWTGNERNEIFSTDGDYVRATFGGCLGEKTDNRNNQEYLEILHKNWVKYNFNEWLNYRNWIYDVLLLQDYLDFAKIPYKFFSAFGENLIADFLNKDQKSLDLVRHAWAPWNREQFSPDMERNLDWKEMCDLITKINLDRWITKNEHTMDSYLMSIGIIEREPGGHPVENGHRCWAEKIATETR